MTRADVGRVVGESECVDLVRFVLLYFFRFQCFFLFEGRLRDIKKNQVGLRSIHVRLTSRACELWRHNFFFFFRVRGGSSCCVYLCIQSLPVPTRLAW